MTPAKQKTTLRVIRLKAYIKLVEKQVAHFESEAAVYKLEAKLKKALLSELRFNLTQAVK